MITQGTDGISLRNLTHGISAGEDMLNHFPWGNTSLKAEPNLLSELQSWSTNILTRLQPRDWFELGHNIQAWRPGPNGLMHPYIRSGYTLWTPPPCVGNIVVE